MSNIPKEISLRIDLTKVDKQWIWQGKDGQKFLELTLKNTPESPFGKDYMAVQSFGKEDRDRIKSSGEEWPKTPILGNGIAWRITDGRKANYESEVANSSEPVQKKESFTPQDDDLPF
jgi:hypothetical protein